MMYLNVNMNGGVGVMDVCGTPRTPEILNSLMALTSPFDGYVFDASTTTTSANAGNNNGNNVHQLLNSPQAGATATTPLEENASSYPSAELPQQQQQQQSRSPATATATAASTTTVANSSSPSETVRVKQERTTRFSKRLLDSHSRAPSVQHTRSQLIKEGLKLTIQTKRIASGQDSIVLEPKIPKIEVDQLTNEDEERRRRRRERNKIAATKCRNKKKEKTYILVQESDSLEGQNISLKTDIQNLEAEKQRLMDILAMHAPSCVKNNNNNSTTNPSQSSPQPQPQPQHQPSAYQPAEAYCHSPADSGVPSNSSASTPTDCSAAGLLELSSYPYASCSFDHQGTNTDGYMAFAGMDNGCVAL